MEKELFKKIESRLYRYFTSINMTKTLTVEIEKLKRQSELLMRDIQYTNISIKADLNLSINYNDEKIQASSYGTSYIEKELIKQINQLEPNLAFINLKILKKKSKVRALEREILSLKFTINNLEEEEKEFINLKYRDKKSMQYVAVDLFKGVKMTAYRKRKKLIEDIYIRIK